MSSLCRIVARALLLLSLAVGAAAATAVPLSPTPAPAGAPTDPSASSLPEVRLRKLHLVRPDLIPYPVAYEVYC